MHECNLYTLLKTWYIIFCTTSKTKHLIELFGWITFNLIQHNIIYNKYQWTVHPIYVFIKFNNILIVKYKTVTFNIYIQILQSIKWKYNPKIIFIHINDGKHS